MIVREKKASIYKQLAEDIKNKMSREERCEKCEFSNADLAQGFQMKDLQISACENWYLENGYGGYGLVSTADDLVKWLHGLFTYKIISQELLQLMVQPSSPIVKLWIWHND